MAFEYLKKIKRKEEHDKEILNWKRSIPHALQGYNLDELLDSNWNGRLRKVSVNAIRKYLQDPNAFMLLHGASGLGKTIMAILIMDKFIHSDVVKSALYIDTPTLLYELSYGDKRQENMIKKMSRPDILIIDDIGAGSVELSNIRKDGIWSIINNRWLNNKMTIFTTNLPITAEGNNDNVVTIQKWFGEAAWDRISHDILIVSFLGESMRRKSFKGEKFNARTVDTVPTVGEPD